MNRLKALRKNRGVTIRSLAESLGMNHSTLTLQEQGKRNFSITSSRAIADFFGVSVDKAVYSVKFGELGKTEELVKAELKRATAAVPRIQDVEELKSALLAFVHSASADTLEYKKRLLATFVERVTVSNDEIVIYFKFPIPGNGDTFKCDYSSAVVSINA